MRIYCLGTVRSDPKNIAVMKKDKDIKRSDIDFQYANNMVAVRWFDNPGVTMVGTCLEKSNKVSIPVPCPEIIKDYNSSMGGVDLLDQKTAAYKLGCKSYVRRYYLDEYLRCKFSSNLQSILHKGNGITRFQNCSG